MVPLAFIPITVLRVVVGVGFMPTIFGVTLVSVRPFVIVECELHAGEFHSVIGMPAIAAPIACGVSQGRRRTEKHRAPDGQNQFWHVHGLSFW